MVCVCSDVCGCRCLFDVFVTLHVTCKFDIDARVCISKNTVKKPLIKTRVAVYLYSITDPPPLEVVLEGSQPTASLAVVHLHYTTETQEQSAPHLGQG